MAERAVKMVLGKKKVVVQKKGKGSAIRCKKARFKPQGSFSLLEKRF